MAPLGPTVLSDRIRFTLPDLGLRVGALSLEMDGALPGARRFARRGPGHRWTLEVPLPTVHRLEYRFRLHGPSGDHLVLDPCQPARVRTAFGDRSVLELPGYRAPWWLGVDTEPGRFDALHLLGALPDALPLTIWQPAGAADADPLPLLLVQDGPEYDLMASISRYSSALIATGRLPAHRLLLCHPVQRDSWYSASRPYLRALTGPALTAVRDRYAVRGPVVALGASLGGLTSLLAGLSRPDLIGGVCSQSGSFFTPGTDEEERGFDHYHRITIAVGAILRTGQARHPLRIGLTWGAEEGNASNNLAMAQALDSAGHRISGGVLADLHNFTAWRDGLDPHLTAVLTDLWT